DARPDFARRKHPARIVGPLEGRMGAPMTPERRVPCPACGAAIVEGARKCRACKRWLSASSDAGVERTAPVSSSRLGRGPRGALLAGSPGATVMALIVPSHRSPVGEAPPLTPMSADPASLAVPHPAAIGDEIESAAEIPPPKTPQAWRA